MHTVSRNIVMRVGAVALIALLVLPAARAAAHCDSLDGPIVPEARAALRSGDVTPILKWVQPRDEQTIRGAFDRTLAVWDRGEDVRSLAEHYFLETLIRIHRAGEGAAYTGLKPAGANAPALTAADVALELGDVETLAARVAEEVDEGIRRRFAAAMREKQTADASVAAGRAYVAAYVEYVHFVEGVHDLLFGAVSAHQETPEGAHEH